MAALKAPPRIWRRISRKEVTERGSAAQTVVARERLSTRGFQRGCVSQTISAFGKDSRRPATAGNVCTISPRELSLTIKKRCSVMRCLADRFEKLPGQLSLSVANNSYADPQPRRDIPLRNRVRHVV